MAITDILAAAQGGQYFANAARASGLTESAARTIIASYATTIARKLKDKAAEDAEAFEALLDLLEEGGDSSDLDDVEAMTGAEAQSDGAAILTEIYGSKANAAKALGTKGEAEETAAALSATGVLAALAASNAPTLLSGSQQAADTSSGGGGIISIIIAALLKGLLQGAQRQLAPKRRRRRYTYSTTRRRITTRRRKRTPGLEDVFRDILTGRK